jgi:hypothetical protein
LYFNLDKDCERTCGYFEDRSKYVEKKDEGETNEKHPNKRQLPALEAFRYEELYPICV